MNTHGAASPQGRLTRGIWGRGPTSALSSVLAALALFCHQAKVQPPPQTFSPHAWEASSISPGGCRARKADTTTRAGLARSWTGSDGVRYRGTDKGGSACGGSGLNRAGRALTGAASPGCWSRTVMRRSSTCFAGLGGWPCWCWSSSITWRCVKWCKHKVQLTPGFSWGLQKGVKGEPFNLVLLGT